MASRSAHTLLISSLLLALASPSLGAGPGANVEPSSSATMVPLQAVRLLEGSPFATAVAANREYLLALDTDRLLAPFRREAGLPAKAQSYGNWESIGLDGHTAGHYLSALAHMIAAGADTPDGQLRRRLTYMLGELRACQDAFGDGYLGGVPGSRELWRAISGGDVAAINKKWVPWYNVHKTFAGLRDAYLEAEDQQARDLLVRLGDWCVALTSHLSDEQMQRMLDQEHGGMNETLADLHAITGDAKYLAAAKRFNHHAVLDPLIAQQDQLTGKHANTQIPKVVGLERIATLTGDKAAESGARFFWENVTGRRSVAFGGNSVSEHFNDPKDFHGLLGHREGPETCNTYNMLRLTEQLFAAGPSAAYADYYERALYNHILASINPQHPGYVYFTPIRPAHYRVYSEVENSFWCCVGTGMENPGKYGEFIYARAADGLYVNLFIASELTAPELGLVLRQETAFPDEESSRLTLKLAAPRTFTLHVRVPGWVGQGAFSIKINGEAVTVDAKPSSYVPLRREWDNGDRVELALPMRTTVEQLPDKSPWYAILRGPLVLAAPSGTWDQIGLRADDSRMAHVAAGPVLPFDKAPSLLADAATIPAKVVADPASGPLHFRLIDIVEPAAPQGVPLVPFFRLHDSRYQMYWETTTRESLAARKEQLTAAERALAAREAATLDRVSPGEQQPEVEHAYRGEETESGLHNGRHWRHGKMIEYTLNTRGEKNVTLSVTYSGSDSGRQFDIFANGVLVATQDLVAERIGEFVDKQYALPAAALASAPDGRITVRFVAKKVLAGGLFDVRLLRAEPAPAPGSNPLFRDAFTADPAPLVVGDTLYLYVGHDEATGEQMFNITEWLCYSTKDMKRWTPHGSVLKPTDFTWATGEAWASQVVEKDGKFFFYTTVQHGEPCVGKAIGVAVGDSPLGPFTDARGTALVRDDTTPSDKPWNDIDPTVFIDDDGTAYLAWGNPYLYFARLKPNMTEIDGEIRRIDLPYYTEGPWLHKRGGLYYLTYAAFAHQGQWEKICYATAPQITGPWTYRGILTDQTKHSYTVHPGIVEFQGRWYLFYHTADLELNGEKGGLGRRSVAVEHLEYNADGTMKPVEQTAAGVSRPPQP